MSNKDMPAWTKELPTEQGMYWNWCGSMDDAPVALNILWSGTSKECFVSRGQYGIDDAIMCKEFGGWWRRIPNPCWHELAALAELEGGDDKYM